MDPSIIEVEFFTGPFAMAGQVDYPEGEGPFPAVLLVPGPPQHDRYGNVRGYKAYNNYFEPLAKAVVSAGVAIFRWDKGGTGMSSSGLSAPMNMISAYKKMVEMPRIDTRKVSILAIGGGSAFVYRKWLELEEKNPIHNLCLLSTGVNHLKLADLEVPICLITRQENILRSQRTLDQYAKEKGVRIAIFGPEKVNEQLMDESSGKINLFNDENVSWNTESLEFVRKWYGTIF